MTPARALDTAGEEPAGDPRLRSASPRRRRYDAELRALLAALAGEDGVPVADRRHRLRRYPACFVGAEAVDWMERRLGCSRAQAVRLGQRLVAVGAVQHVSHEHDFEDGPIFYRFAARSAEAPAAFTLPEPVFRELCAALRGAGGIRVGTRHSGLIRYPRCFAGAELVDWIVGRTGLERGLAVQVGQRMLEHNLVRHVFDEQPLRDGRYFYRLL